MDKMKRGTFIKKASVFSMTISFVADQIGLPEKKQLIDRIWLWGHNAGGHHKPINTYKLPGNNLMDPKEACDYLRIRKCCRVALGKKGPFPPFDKEAEKLKGLKEVVWSSIGDSNSEQHEENESDLNEILKIADSYDNISGAILDDFFITPTADGRVGTHSLESIGHMRDKLHNFSKRSLDLWLVWYTHQLNYDLEEYIKLFDVATLWEWKGSNLINLDENIRKFIDKTPRKRRFVGCYLWNFGEKMPMTVPQMEHQLQICHDWIKNGKIEGIILCANTVVDLGLETVEYTRKWISKYGSSAV
jgi:hypothetical protein